MTGRPPLLVLEVRPLGQRPHLAGVLQANSAGVRPFRPHPADGPFEISFGRQISHRTPQRALRPGRSNGTVSLS